MVLLVAYIRRVAPKNFLCLARNCLIDLWFTVNGGQPPKIQLGGHGQIGPLDPPELPHNYLQQLLLYRDRTTPAVVGVVILPSRGQRTTPAAFFLKTFQPGSEVHQPGLNPGNPGGKSSPACNSKLEIHFSSSSFELEWKKATTDSQHSGIFEKAYINQHW